MAFLVGGIYLVLGVGQVLSPSAEQIPLTGDSQSYLRTASGISHCITHPGWTIDHLFSGGFSPEEKQNLGFDGWILHHAPLYLIPLGISQAMGTGETGARIVTILFLALLGGFVFDLGRRLFSPLVGLCAALITLLDPATLLYGTAVLTEIPLAFLVVLIGWIFVRWVEQKNPRWSLILGLGFGLLYLGKITFRPLLPILVLMAAAYLWKRQDRVRLLVFLGLGLAIILIPWWLGLLSLDLPLNPVAESGEDMLWLFRGNNVHLQGWETVGAGDASTPELQQAVAEIAGQSDVLIRKAYQRALFLGIQHQPLQWAALVGRKLVLFWTHPAVKNYTSHPFWTMPPWLILFPLLILVACFGWLLSFDGPRRWIPAVPILYLSAAHALSHLVSRYNVPTLPIVYLYAAAAPWILLRAPWIGTWRKADWRPSAGWFLIGGTLAALALGFFTAHPLWRPSAADVRSLSWLASLFKALGLALAGLAGAWILKRSTHVGHRTPWGLISGGILGGILILSWRGSDPDWDLFSVRLEKSGDRVVQRIAIPHTLPLSRIESGHLEIDMLRSISSEFTLEVWVNGRLAHTYNGGLGAEPYDFTLSPLVHGYQERYLRIIETLTDHMEGDLEPRYKDRNPGLDAYRRWVRVPLEPGDYMGRDTLSVSLVLQRAGPGAYIEIFGDQVMESSPGRVLRGPAFFTNAYLLSNYRFRVLAGDRREADVRLTTDIPLDSSWSESSFWKGDRPSRDLSRDFGVQRGEYRIRLRLRMPGRYVWREEKGQPRLKWIANPTAEDRNPTGEEVRQKMIYIQGYFDGFATL